MVRGKNGTMYAYFWGKLFSSISKFLKHCNVLFVFLGLNPTFVVLFILVPFQTWPYIFRTPPYTRKEMSNKERSYFSNGANQQDSKKLSKGTPRIMFPISKKYTRI